MADGIVVQQPQSIQIDIQPEVKQDDQQHVQAMLDKVEGKEATLIAGKYKSEDDLNRGITELLGRQSVEERTALYKQLESQLGKKPEQTPAESKEETKAAPDQKLNPANALKVDEKVEEKASQIDELDMQKYMDEYYNSEGKLSEDTYKELQEKYKLPKGIVDSYIEGQKAIADQFNGEIYSKVGGEQSYQQMIQWAVKNLSDAEKVEFNAAVGSMDRVKAGLAVEALQSRFVKANGSTPNLINGESGPSGLVGYQSRQEMTRDINDPRYASDPAWRRMVQERIKRSDVI